MPPKAAYKEFDADPSLEFEFFLAEKLSRTVGELRQMISQDEFMRWGVYYGRIAQRQEMEEKRARSDG